MSDWPPGPPGSGMSWLNDPRRRQGVASAPERVGSLTGPADENRPGPAPSASSRPVLAVLVPAGLKTIETSVLVPARDLAAVARRALAESIRQVWVGPHMVRQLGLPEQLERNTNPPAHPWLGAAVRDGWEAAPAGLAPWIELRREGARLELVFPGWDPDGNPFAAATTPQVLLEALGLYANQLRLRYRWSPGASGLALMRAVHSGPGAIPLPLVGTPAPPAVDGYDSASSGAWLGELPKVGWLHAFDLNGMFLAACSSAELGFGDATHDRAPARIGNLTDSVTGAGYFLATVRPPRKLPAWELPFKYGRPHWYTAPGLAFLLELGCAARIAESWIYPEARRWLEPWYARLRDARAALGAEEGPAAALALGAVKRTYAAALGRLAGRWLDVGDASFRPDWRHVVIDRARANMHRHLLKAARPPLALSADLAIWASDQEGPAAAAADLGLEVSAQLGKWKHEGAITAAQAAAVTGKVGGSRLRRLRALVDALEASRGPV